MTVKKTTTKKVTTTVKDQPSDLTEGEKKLWSEGYRPTDRAMGKWKKIYRGN